jgi:hypothetical protein
MPGVASTWGLVVHPLGAVSIGAREHMLNTQPGMAFAPPHVVVDVLVTSSAQCCHLQCTLLLWTNEMEHGMDRQSVQ